MCRKKKNCSCIFLLFFGMGERAWHPEKCIALSDVYDWVNGTMRACGDAGLHLWLVGFRVRDKVRLGLVLGIGVNLTQRSGAGNQRFCNLISITNYVINMENI